MSSLPLAALGESSGFQSDLRFSPALADLPAPGDPLAEAWHDGHAAGRAEARAEAQALAEAEDAARARIELSFARLDAELAEALRQKLVVTVTALCEAALAPLALDRDALLRRVDLGVAQDAAGVDRQAAHHAREQVEHPVARRAVARVRHRAEDRHHVRVGEGLGEAEEDQAGDGERQQDGPGQKVEPEAHGGRTHARHVGLSFATDVEQAGAGRHDDGQRGEQVGRGALAQAYSAGGRNALHGPIAAKPGDAALSRAVLRNGA